ncbi:MFS transporter [Subtercola lobariae]|uniref:MFS transporter n=1 Tax=Subtercola lobariae TaxID=1588641 RepID=A0A917EWR7_9MICO|nr:MFS transporter [Subtercola lobariae]
MIGVSLGVAMIVVDTTIVNVITPAVIDDLGIDSSQAQWIQESYAITFAALLLVFGRLSDLIGARRVFTIGIVAFGATSLLAGLAPSGDILIAARFLQGAAGAMLLPTSLALLNQTFTGATRNLAFAVWGSTIGAATAVGPVIGGWLSEHASWRWAFGINVPLVIVVLVLIVTCILPSAKRAGSIDAVGAVLSAIGLATLAFGLIEGRTYGWVTTERSLDVFGFSWNSGLSPVFVSLLIALVALSLFVWRQVRLSREGSSREPLMDTRLFRISSFRNGNVATLIIGLGEFGIIAIVPLWLQFALNYSPLQAGVALLPLAGGSFIASGLSFSVASRLSAIALVRIGLVLEATGLVALGVVAATTSAPWWAISLALFVYGIGVGFATAQVTNVVLAEVPAEDAGQGGGIQSTFRQLGSALGIAALTTLFFSTLRSGVTDSLTSSGVPTDQANQFASAITDSAGAAIAQLGANPATAAVAQAARDAMASGVAIGAYVAAGTLLLGFISTLFIPRAKDHS